MPALTQATAALAATALLAAGSAAAQTTLSFQHGVAGYLGAADTYLRGASPDEALGGDFDLSIDASDGGAPSQGLMRFDALFGTAPGQIRLDDTIVSATLTVIVTSGGSGILFHEMLRPWDEATATWTSMGNGLQADGVEARVDPVLAVGANDGSSNIPAGTYVFDFTAALQRAQAGFAPHGWALLPFMPSGTNGVDFYTREWPELSERPLLTVQVTPIPEPGTLALWLAGGALLAGALRRRA